MRLEATLPHQDSPMQPTNGILQEAAAYREPQSSNFRQLSWLAPPRPQVAASSQGMLDCVQSRKLRQTIPQLLHTIANS